MVLVDGTDGITEKTGQTGTAYISKNGATPVATSANITEVDSTNLPGHYYVELLASELDTLGFLSVRYKAAGTAAFQWVGQVVADDPYINHSGPGMSGGSSGRAVSGLKKEEMVELAKMIWNVLLRGKSTAKDVLLEVLDRPDFDPTTLPAPTTLDLTPILKQLEPLEQLEDLADGQRQTLAAVKGLKIPDAGKQLEKLLAQITSIAAESKIHTTKLNSFDPKQLGQILTAAATQITDALQSLETAVNQVSQTGDQLEQTQAVLADIATEVAQAMNLNNRFKEMSDAINEKAVSEVRDAVLASTKRILLAVTEAKFKLLEKQLKRP